ncbi:MAG TPA: hypothetical protein VM580_04760 [Labilithrix sp.]|nr:hypothetical protein [Labilithrix sp.]
MGGSSPPGKPIPESVQLAAEKARSERLHRLKTTLARRLENPIAALDALIAEAAEGEAHAELWEQLHAAAIRDGLEAGLADAYLKCLNGPRMKRLVPEAQAAVLMHTADYFQGVRGDAATSQDLLHRVLRVAPGHPEAFGRLERRLEKLLDARGLLGLYASVAAAPPKPANVLATQAFHRLLQLVGKEPLSDDDCKRLVLLVPSHPKLLDALETHCRTTKRPGLACEIIEEALLHETALEETNVQRRHRLVELYTGEVASPEKAIEHVECLLEYDPSDGVALKAAERLLGSREVASRAAAALTTARRSRTL